MKEGHRKMLWGEAFVLKMSWVEETLLKYFSCALAEQHEFENSALC